MSRLVFAATIAIVFSASAVQAETVLPNTSWGSLPGENSGGASAAITGTQGRSGTGSLELSGDRTRFTNGNYFDRSTSGMFAANTVQSLVFDWRLASAGTNTYSADYTPALRLHVYDPTSNTRSELIWEGAYNQTYGNTSLDTWYTTGTNDNFYQFVTGSGVTLNGGAQVNQSLAAWTAGYSAQAIVKAVSVGTGSGASATYHAFADNVTLGFRTGDTRSYNFEVAAMPAVPEPATWAMMIAGFGMAGSAMRRRRSAAQSHVRLA